MVREAAVECGIANNQKNLETYCENIRDEYIISTPSLNTLSKLFLLDLFWNNLLLLVMMTQPANLPETDSTMVVILV